MKTNQRKSVWSVRKMFGSNDNPDNTDQGNTTPDYKSLYESAQRELLELKDTSVKSYTGLQRTLSQEQVVAKKTAETLAEVTQRLEQMTASHGELNQKATQLAEAEEKARKELVELRVDRARKNLIISKYPGLAPFEAEGLIPMPKDAVDAEGNVDEAKFVSIFEAFSGKIGALSQAQQRNFNAGGTPPTPPAPQGPTTPAVLLAEANAHAMRGDTAKFDAAYQKYIDALKQ